MKVIICTEAYFPLIDGGAVAERHLAHGLRDKGHEVHILAPSLGYSDSVEDDFGTTIHRFASHPIPLVKNDHRLAFLPKSKIYKLLDRIKPDILHIHNPFPIGKASLKYGLEKNIPIIATNHWLPENITTFMAKFRFLNSSQFLVNMNWKFIVDFHNKCQFVTSPTQTAVDLMLNQGLVAPNRPVSNGVDVNVFKPGLDVSGFKKKFNLPDKVTGLYAGRLSGEKHVDVFVRAIKEISDKVDAHFIIGGDGRERLPLIEMANELGIADKVTFPGFLDEEEFPLLYNSADFFVMPSICELQSITTLEAMASGLPVIACNKYALPELVQVDKNGFLFEAEDHETLSKHIETIVSSSDLRQEMSKQSLDIVSHHSIQSTVNDYESIYFDLTNSK